ncbi:aminotransferase class V-fold PLP-dependent enzyme [Mycoplasmopsis alligatoris]|uniref:Aminotransferase, class V n=1 Tax=Mycoplasmopsis alligatoris A21JP2 TaxID=747682 RepID=D4XW18_9BACT|nr:aminotransferase class V-fold PLP-dependent enzyme [Mycoplasmopsis alligatoris]EFF41478.1 aminotransferase, class V [Mycoplasmopsis alligatoris A21JP2]
MYKNIKNQFPILKKITYFDSAALVLKPKSAINAINNFYLNASISSRTADTPLGNLVNQTIAELRQKVAKLIKAEAHNVIFTSGTTESINNMALMMEQVIKKNDIILLSAYNHSSNMLPWIEMAKKVGATIIVSENIEEDINQNVKLISLSQETNNFNEKLNLKNIYKKANLNGTIIVNDAAQAIAHQEVSFDNCDVIAFSANKFYGPTGLGVLAIKDRVLKKIRPSKFGGGSVAKIDKNNNWTLKETIAAFEPGTPDLAGMFMFNKAIDFFNTIGYKKTKVILKKLSIYLHTRLSSLSNVEVFTQPGDIICLINVKNVNAQDVATYLGDRNIYTIAGIFCAPYLRNIKPNSSYLRISLGIYNDFSDIDKLTYELENGGMFLEI